MDKHYFASLHTPGMKGEPYNSVLPTYDDCVKMDKHYFASLHTPGKKWEHYNPVLPTYDDCVKMDKHLLCFPPHTR